jgi:carboxypeptidase Q
MTRCEGQVTVKRYDSGFTVLAVAALVRSVTARSLRTPHTGSLGYGDAKVKIPAAAITTEDAQTIAGLQRLGVPVVVNLKMEARTLPDAESANVIAELRGREKPEEIVVIGGHFDAWDVGHGAHDDGGGCVIAMEAINVLRKLKMIPRRTIRVVLWTNEENGVRGARAYAEEHADELEHHVAGIESDMGVFKPTGYSVECGDDARAARAVEQLGDLLSVFSTSPIGPLDARLGFSGVDIRPMKSAGVVLLGHQVENANYFDLHHSPADTLDKVDPGELSENVAVLAVAAYILADMPERLGELPAAEQSVGK